MSAEVWPWIWLAVAAAAVLGEMASAGSFFLLPFAAGAGVACALAFLDVSAAVQWLAFVAVSVAGVVATRPLARRLDQSTPTDGIGAKRWMGQSATVLEAIPEGETECGLVRIGREQWRAESRDGRAVPQGAVVRVVDVRGTRLVVWPAAELGHRPDEAKEH